MTRIPLPLAPRWLRWVGVAGVTPIIVYFSLITTVPATADDPGLAQIWDKKVYFVAYAEFAFALAYATVEWQSRRLERSSGVIGLALAFGIVIELVQGQLPMRYYSHIDLLANAIGASLVVPWLVLERRVRYLSVGKQADEECR